MLLGITSMPYIKKIPPTLSVAEQWALRGAR